MAIVLFEGMNWPPLLHRQILIAKLLKKLHHLDAEETTFEFPLSPHRLLKSRCRQAGLPETITKWNFPHSFLWSLFYMLSSIIPALQILLRLKTKQDLQNLRIDGLWVGDLIYDSYMRIKNVPTVNMRDFYFFSLVLRTRAIKKFSERYFTCKEVRLFITAHTCYISPGTELRVALSKGIPCFTSFGNPFEFVRIKPEAPMLQEDYTSYPEIFSTFDNQEEKRNIARRLLQNRLSGSIDTGTAYMRTSAYIATDDESRAFNGSISGTNIVVMLHCFFDSPHIYRWMIFPDFWEWIEFLLQEAAKTPWDWYIKPHPNGLEGNEKFVERLRQKYGVHKNIHFLDKRTSNKTVIANVRAAFTVWGTMAHEFAYCGIPVVNAGDNPHIRYDFCRHPKTAEELRSLVHDAGRLMPPADPKKVEEYFFMHYVWKCEPKTFDFCMKDTKNYIMDIKNYIPNTNIFDNDATKEQRKMRKKVFRAVSILNNDNHTTYLYLGGTNA